MELKQFQVMYRIDEDRLLLRVSCLSQNGALEEIRAWMTRHLLKTLWPGIIKALETQVALDHPEAAHASAEIVSMEHQASIDEIRSLAEFDLPFAPKVDRLPFGEQPILLTKAHISLSPKQAPRINFVGVRGGSFEVAFTSTMLHGFCTLLQDAAKLADWDIELRMPGTETTMLLDEQRMLN